MTRGRKPDRIPIDAQAVRSRLKQLGMPATEASRRAWMSSSYLSVALRRGYVTGDALKALQTVLGAEIKFVTSTAEQKTMR